ncbi:monovalent cation:proton antiporter-2 (CPA2) family protein [Spectribacter hydrogenoxidans]|uniref:Monovalent cation:proton antiporter-2 (CPA2) family protein n=1 Tax=Spectribacter hydrogenoxidans TaxID=3075608 RepID=A0ABU3BWR0_9GAMM|nr:monovalent cation:proton antiporter-2 (CPA2) family protein [Salinisphaera sp. W335]MDT0633735.1 monovalent cation:proton antiporter-2 (CPA2) family protein [Salinisphaera sp. W335]
MSEWLQPIAIFLTAAVVAVPLAQRLKLGSILGYLIAGAVIGPWGLGAIAEVEDVLHIAEFGVVLLLFVIGLEMQPRRLWALRKTIVGLGGMQVLISGLLLGAAALALGMPPAAAVVAGAALALSSTAFGLQLLAERGELTARHGRSAFGILLFQDLAVIPILALLPLLAVGGEAMSLGGALLDTAKVAAVLGGMVIGGHYLLRPVFRIVAATRMPEIFTAWALLVVIGTAVIMEQVDVSVALGAFVAGVLLADSEYRPELETNIDPFKDLLLGLFFIAVGMSLNLGLLLSEPLRLVLLTLALLTIKGLVLYILGRRHGLDAAAARNLAAVLPQGGEFAFVILAAAVAAGVFEQTDSDMVVAVVTLSMAATPLLAGGAAWLNRRLQPAGGDTRSFDTPDEYEHPVIIAGFGRVAQIVARLLTAKGVAFTALEINPDTVDFVRRFGDKIYYGDASRIDLLRHAGADEARVFVLAIGDPEASVRTAEAVLEHFPHLKIIAAARNRQHVFALKKLGVSVILREKFLSSLEMGGETLQALGASRSEAVRAASLFRQYDEELLDEQAASSEDTAKLVQMREEAMAELEELFERDSRGTAGDAADEGR